jgi:hypothetical protein
MRKPVHFGVLDVFLLETLVLLSAKKDSNVRELGTSEFLASLSKPPGKNAEKELAVRVPAYFELAHVCEGERAIDLSGDVGAGGVRAAVDSANARRTR